MLYLILGALFVGLVYVVGKYLFSLGKNEDVSLSLEMDELGKQPKTELKLEVVKAAPPEKPVKVAKKKTAIKKKTVAKKKAKAVSQPPAENP